MEQKELWIKADHDKEWDKRKKLVTNAIEIGADAVVVRNGEVGKVRKLGIIKVIANDKDADIFLENNVERLSEVKGETAFYREIKSKKDEEIIANAGKFSRYVIVKALNWKVIPLENLIALLRGKSKIIVEVENLEDAKLALETLEVGADGILVNSGVKEAKRIKKFIDEISTGRLELKPVRVINIKQVGMGDRVCVDTCSIFEIGEGMLIGSQSSALFLIHSETIETPYVETRPFRVNAGPVHAYTRMPDGSTKYLSELNAGDEILAVNWKGDTRRMVVGRLKIEKRPLLLIEAEFNGKKFKTLVQNAETIRLVDKKGKAISVVDLKKGDEVLAYIEDKGRHFGIKVDESIEEK
ncbi:MAG: 3-dehydroquinate synthase II [Candidatus Altiarchaeales archaeon]|nr:MAG: 3-dehydroquinate synthase II [Candidatus Altiarchaeales archaeon]RLI94138.1 MAG: 3-dehydroquinate synthase II [Candidatus Altiarchaeales archaeon]